MSKNKREKRKARKEAEAMEKALRGKPLYGATFSNSERQMMKKSEDGLQIKATGHRVPGDKYFELPDEIKKMEISSTAWELTDVLLSYLDCECPEGAPNNIDAANHYVDREHSMTAETFATAERECIDKGILLINDDKSFSLHPTVIEYWHEITDYEMQI